MRPTRSIARTVLGVQEPRALRKGSDRRAKALHLLGQLRRRRCSAECKCVNAPSGGRALAVLDTAPISSPGTPARFIPVSIARCQAPPPAVRSTRRWPAGRLASDVRFAARARRKVFMLEERCEDEDRSRDVRARAAPRLRRRSPHRTPRARVRSSARTTGTAPRPYASALIIGRSGTPARRCDRSAITLRTRPESTRPRRAAEEWFIDGHLWGG